MISADNYIGIWKRGSLYFGYDLSASSNEVYFLEPKELKKAFVVSSIKKAILRAQALHAEYGYLFMNLT